jgi:hypothetical protein
VYIGTGLSKLIKRYISTDLIWCSSTEENKTELVINTAVTLTDNVPRTEGELET